MKILVFGATSAVAQAFCRLAVARGAEFFLVGRHAARLAAVAEDLRVRGAKQVETALADLDELASHHGLVERAAARLGELDVVLLAQGVLGDPEACRREGSAAASVLVTNLVAPASLLTHVAARMEERGAGCIVAISSVAGDRGRQSNYVYGAAKGGLSIFLQGLRNRLWRKGVHVVTAKPGFIDTPMTAHLPKNRLYASPVDVAAGILRAVDHRSDVVYLPWFWRWIMLIIRSIPERLFKRLSL